MRVAIRLSQTATIGPVVQAELRLGVVLEGLIADGVAHEIGPLSQLAKGKQHGGLELLAGAATEQLRPKQHGVDANAANVITPIGKHQRDDLAQHGNVLQAAEAFALQEPLSPGLVSGAELRRGLLCRWLRCQEGAERRHGNANDDADDDADGIVANVWHASQVVLSGAGAVIGIAQLLKVEVFIGADAQHLAQLYLKGQ